MSRLVWFRSDLRVSDNVALVEAASASFDGPVYGVFLPTVKQWKEHDWGEAKTSFVLRSAEALRKNLEQLGIPLFFLRCESFKQTSKVLKKLFADLEIDELYANFEYEVNERKRDEEVAKLCEKSKVDFHLFHDQTCLPPQDPELRTGAGKPYTVFSPFKKTWVRVIEERGMPSVRRKPKGRERPSRVVVEGALESLEGLTPNLNYLAEYWPGGEKEAISRLKKFTSSAIVEYGTDRDFPAKPGTSQLSPYLAAGVISPRKCLAYAVKANGDALTLERNGEMVWASELIWREFYRHVLIYHERVCKNRAFKEEIDKVEWRYDEEEFERWKAGQTGYPIVDAAMRQLEQTGWMHNRLRMVVAMFLTKHLLIDWRWGEKYFSEKLVDLDFASNNGGWQWSSSTGTDAQPYFRIFNPYSQSEKFDKEGVFIKQYCPELSSLIGKGLHCPDLKMLETLGYPAPVVEHKFGRERALKAFKRN